MISFIFKFIVLIILICILSGMWRTWFLEESLNQKLFVAGSMPNPMPNGLYSGTIGRKVSWLGKKFEAKSQTGINLFEDKNGKSQKYPFKTFVGRGVRDKGTVVLKIDYNISGNPFWLRFILDEIVEVSPDHYLGKLHVVAIPGFVFTLGFFELKK